MASAPQELMTAEDPMAMPSDGTLHELVRGRLVEVPPSFSDASMVAAHVGMVLGSFVRRHDLGVCSGAGGGVRTTTNPDSARIPDLPFFGWARLPGGKAPRRGFLSSPDLAVEVLSGDETFTDMLDKIDEYLAAGTRLVWAIDLGRRIAWVFYPDGRRARIASDGALDGEDVLPGLRVPLSALWEGLADGDEGEAPTPNPAPNAGGGGSGIHGV